jgi:hypothetical protein
MFTSSVSSNKNPSTPSEVRSDCPASEVEMTQSFFLNQTLDQAMEDFINEHTTVSIHRKSLFFLPIQKIAAELGFEIDILNSKKCNSSPNEWPRDTYYKTLSADRTKKMTSVAQTNLKFEESVAKKWPRFNQTAIFGNERIKTLFYDYDFPLRMMSQPNRELSSGFKSNPFLLYLDRKHNIYKEMKCLSTDPDSVRTKKTSLEGGNLFTAINSKGQLHFILGESAVPHYAFYRDILDPEAHAKFDEMYARKIDSNGKSVVKWKSFYHKNLKLASRLSPFSTSKDLALERIKSKFALGHELNAGMEGEFQLEWKKNLIVIPQYMYHIDLQMAYLGHSRILVHSFQETHGFLKKNKEKILADLKSLIEKKFNRFSESPEELYLKLLYVNESLASEFETSIIDESIRKLEKHGFIVQKCFGNLFFDFPKSGAINSGLLSLFMNGISGYSSKLQTDYFLTANSPLPSAKEYFEGILSRKFGIKTYFLDTIDPFDPEKKEDIMNFIEQTAGSLRCSVNTNL